MLYIISDQYYKTTIKKIADEYDNYLRQYNIFESQENPFDLESNDKIQNIDKDPIKSNTNNSNTKIQNADNTKSIKSNTIFDNINNSRSRLAINSINSADSVNISSTTATASRALVYQIISNTSQKRRVDSRDLLLNT